MAISIGALLDWRGIMERAWALDGRLYAPSGAIAGLDGHGFSANLNVSVVVRLAGIGPDHTMVRSIADPSVSRNCHAVTVEGGFGLLRVHIENIPPENPKTGRLTVLSIIRSVRDITYPIPIGT